MFFLFLSILSQIYVPSLIVGIFIFQKISKAYELSNLLVSLFAVVDGKNDEDCDKPCPYLLQSRRKPIDDVVEEKLDTIRKKSEKLRKNSNSKKR